MTKKLAFIIIAILLAGICGLGYYNHTLQQSLRVTEQNYKASNDSVKILYKDNEKLIYEKNAYILKESELKDMLDMNTKEIKELKQSLQSSISYISKIEGKVRADTIYMNDTIYYKDSIPTIHFGYKDDWLSLSGTTSFKPLQTKINNIQVPISIETGLTEDYNIFVKTNNPYVTIQNIDGAIIKDKKINIDYHHELQVGMGFQYGLFNNQIDFGPQIGYGFVIEF